MIKIPSIGDTITPELGIDLCRRFGMHGVADRVAEHPERYRAFEYDGCTGLPDDLFKRISFAGLDWGKITDLCCLPHDLGYAYGIPGDEAGRALQDYAFFEDLQFRAGVPEAVAAIFLDVVRRYGRTGYGADFSWSFAVR